jgi:predicted DNA-binding WGR domain protein
LIVASSSKVTEPAASPRVYLGKWCEAAIWRKKSRYVVMNQNGGWQIRNAHCHVITNFPSKVQALYAAIELAEKDGKRGYSPEVQDDRFITEWVYGEDLHPDEAARPAATAILL